MFPQPLLASKNAFVVLSPVLPCANIRHNDIFPHSVTLADIAFFPNLAYMVRLGLEINKFPVLQAYYRRMVVRPSVIRSWPPHWNEKAGLPMLNSSLMRLPDTQQ